MKATKHKCPECGLQKTYRPDVDKCKDCAKPKQAPVETDSVEQSAEERVIKKVVTKHVQTVEELAEVCQIDRSVWEITRWKCGTWTTGMKNKKTNTPFYSTQFVVQAWLKPKYAVIAANKEIEELRKKAEKYVQPKTPFLMRDNEKNRSQTAVEYSIFDHHFGALIWGKETNWADYDSKIAKDCWEKALTALVARTKQYNPEKVLLVLGNDQINIDNRAGNTEKGTPQESDSRYQKMFGISRDATIWAIDTLAQVCPQVEAVLVPGNHDYLATWHLGDSLQAWFRRSHNITIDNTPAYRKYWQYGTNLLMLTHGNKGSLEKYGEVMAAERPDLWGQTQWREAHTGDKHHRRVIEFKGSTVRILPSLRPPCGWSSENHYIGAIRAAEAYVWHKQEGMIASATYSILDSPMCKGAN